MNNNLQVNYYILVRYLASSWKTPHTSQDLLCGYIAESVCGLAWFGPHDDHHLAASLSTGYAVAIQQGMMMCFSSRFQFRSDSPAKKALRQVNIIFLCIFFSIYTVEIINQ